MLASALSPNLPEAHTVAVSWCLARPLLVLSLVGTGVSLWTAYGTPEMHEAWVFPAWIGVMVVIHGGIAGWNYYIKDDPSVSISTWQEPANQSYSPTSASDEPSKSAMRLQAPVTADVDFTMSRKFASTSETIFNSNNPSLMETNYSISVAPTPLLQFRE